MGHSGEVDSLASNPCLATEVLNEVGKLSLSLSLNFIAAEEAHSTGSFGED